MHDEQDDDDDPQVEQVLPLLLPLDAAVVGNSLV